MLFDTHAHYDDTRFDEDRDALLRSMPEQGVGLIVNPGCDLSSSQKAVTYANTYDFMYAAVGYHPENLDDGVDLGAIRTLATENPKVRAIGEIGLDYYWEKDAERRVRQQETYRAQMQLAESLGLPVIIHNRDAHADCLAITKEFPNVRGVYHCYAGNVPMALELIKLGYYISFTGVITYKNARRSLEVIETVPIERLMIETDAPYMSPEPYRGRRNSSLYLHRMAETIATIKGMDVSDVERITTENGKSFYGIA